LILLINKVKEEIKMKKWKLLLSCNGGDFFHIVEAETEEDLKQQLCALDVWKYVTKYWEM
jgi:transcriptional regulator of NAD metabolism